MKILCLESTAKAAGVALLSDDQTLGEILVRSGTRSHTELLIPMVQSLLESCGSSLDEIGLFACTTGPGSFTGVRIGVSAIKGLAFGKNLPCAAVSSLEALAENLSPLDGLLCPLMDARRSEVYNALFEIKDGELIRLTPDRALPIDTLCEEIKTVYNGRAVRLVGDGVGVALPRFLEAGLTVLPTPDGIALQSAAAVGRCAWRQFKAGKAVSDLALSPLYLRMPQAERERIARLEMEKENKTIQNTEE